MRCTTKCKTKLDLHALDCVFIWQEAQEKLNTNKFNEDASVESPPSFTF
jgi:hypothetical protein